MWVVKESRDMEEVRMTQINIWGKKQREQQHKSKCSEVRMCFTFLVKSKKASLVGAE